MSDEPAANLARTALFAGLSGQALTELASLTSLWQAPAGEVLFRRGERGDRLLVVTSGRLEAVAPLPRGGERSFGTIGPGEVVGELALLAGGPRAATVRAVEASTGIAVGRDTFELLRLQQRPAATMVVRRVGDTALRRLHGCYAALAAQPENGGDANATNHADDSAPVRIVATDASDRVSDRYLAEILFFRRFGLDEIAEMRAGLRVLAAPRGTALDTREALWIVLRGALETGVRRGGVTRRVRLAGPGRCVGHLGLLSEDAAALPLETTLRERAVVLEVPLTRGKQLLAGEGPGAQRFAEALHEDAVRALLAAESPHDEMIAAPTPTVSAAAGDIRADADVVASSVSPFE